MNDDLVFRALGDPTRRTLLDSLFAVDGQTVTELCAPLAEQMTRFGVMKHLAQLEEANLVTSLKQGRHKRYFLNPIPVQQIADRWIAKYSARYVAGMVALGADLEALHQSHKEAP